jgi:hypothetical protein
MNLKVQKLSKYTTLNHIFLLENLGVSAILLERERERERETHTIY